MATQKRKIRFNVGGKIFETTATTLYNAGENSLLRTMLDECWSAQYEEFGEHFIDRDPACFHVLLHLLRTGKLLVPPTIPDTLLFREAHYYGLLDQVRAAKSVELDGDNLKLASSITGKTLLKDDALIRANTNGSCCVANGGLFHVYDWMLQEHCIGNFDYMKIVDMEWYDLESIIISAQKYSDPKCNSGGGVGLFNAQTAELKHKFQLTQTYLTSYETHVVDDEEFFTMTPGNLAVDNFNNNLFCCCKKYSSRKIDDIGVWDTTTGQQVGFFRGNYISNNSNSFNSFNSFKLQWLPINNCLVAASSSHQSNIISIFDPRRKTMHLGSFEWSQYNLKRPGRMLVDMVVMEEMNCICVKDENCFFGFLDLRKLVERSFNGVRRSFEEQVKLEGDEQYVLVGETNEAIAPCSKVRWHEGKLFCSRKSTISVYSRAGFKWQLASQVQPKYGGGSIHDFSIGGNRLFSLQAHKEHDLYDINVWETPPSPSPLQPILM